MLLAVSCGSTLCAPAFAGLCAWHGYLIRQWHVYCPSCIWHAVLSKHWESLCHLSMTTASLRTTISLFLLVLHNVIWKDERIVCVIPGYQTLFQQTQRTEVKLWQLRRPLSSHSLDMFPFYLSVTIADSEPLGQRVKRVIGSQMWANCLVLWKQAGASWEP